MATARKKENSGTPARSSTHAAPSASRPSASDSSVRASATHTTSGVSAAKRSSGSAVAAVRAQRLSEARVVPVAAGAPSSSRRGGAAEESEESSHTRVRAPHDTVDDSIPPDAMPARPNHDEIDSTEDSMLSVSGASGHESLVGTIETAAVSSSRTLLSAWMPDDDTSGDQPLTLRMIQQAVGPGVDEDALLATRVLRLSWLNVTSMDAVELFSECRELYLQHNRIERIEGLDAMLRLEFLALGSNRIHNLSGLSHLRHLKVLDISHNAIDTIEEGDLPPAIQIINAKGNPFAQQGGYRRRLLDMLPDCVCIDMVDVTTEEQAGIDLAPLGDDDDGKHDDGSDRVGPASGDDDESKLEDDSADAAGQIADFTAPQGSSHDVAARFGERRMKLSERYAAALADASERLAAVTTAAALQGTADMEAAIGRLRSVRQGMVARLAAQEASLAQEAADTIREFKAIGHTRAE